MEDAISTDYAFPKANDGANEQQNEKDYPEDGATRPYAAGSDFCHSISSLRTSRFQRRVTR